MVLSLNSHLFSLVIAIRGATYSVSIQFLMFMSWFKQVTTNYDPDVDSTVELVHISGLLSNGECTKVYGLSGLVQNQESLNKQTNPKFMKQERSKVETRLGNKRQGMAGVSEHGLTLKSMNTLNM